MDKLSQSRLGCFISNTCLNSLMYAEYLVLQSISVCDLQALVHICVNELDLIDMVVNCSTSGCLRIGNRHSAEVGSNSVGNNVVHWLNEICYLGVTILSGKKFSVNSQKNIFVH